MSWLSKGRGKTNGCFETNFWRYWRLHACLRLDSSVHPYYSHPPKDGSWRKEVVGWGLKEAMCWGKASAVGRWPVTHWESVIPFSCNFLCYFQLTAVFSSFCRDHTTSEYKLCHPALPHPLTALSTSPNLLHPKPRLVLFYIKVQCNLSLA